MYNKLPVEARDEKWRAVSLNGVWPGMGFVIVLASTGV